MSCRPLRVCEWCGDIDCTSPRCPDHKKRCGCGEYLDYCERNGCGVYGPEDWTVVNYGPTETPFFLVRGDPKIALTGDSGIRYFASAEAASQAVEFSRV